MRPVVLTPARQRARWLERRRDNGRDRPRPVVVRFINGGSVSFAPVKAQRIYETALEKPGRFGRPHVVAACELADVDAKAVGGEEWQTFQRGPVGSPESALGVAVRRSRARLSVPALVRGSAATREGGGIRLRPILKVAVLFDPGTPNGWACTFKIGHAPPARAPKARGDYLRRFAAVPARAGMADLNIGRRWALRLLGHRVFSSGVLHVTVRRWIPTRFATVDVGSDHLAIDVLFWP